MEQMRYSRAGITCGFTGHPVNKTQLLPVETVRSTGQEETISNCVEYFSKLHYYPLTVRRHECSKELLTCAIRFLTCRLNSPIQRSSRWIGNSERFTESAANIPKAEVQRSIEGHKESPQRLSRSTGTIPVRLIEVFQRQRLLISLWGRSSVSRNGENSTYGSTRGLREC